MLSPEELPGARMVALCRVSSLYDNSETSLERQDSYLAPEIEKLRESHDGELVQTYKLGESASTMDRESLEEIETMAKNDEFDVLLVWAIHRFTRANPWDTFDYLLRLREHDIVIYTDRDGYFDWDDPDDASRMCDRITTSREWRNEIHRGAQENNRMHLREGRWPYGPTPYGTEKKETAGGDDHEFVVTTGYECVIEEIFCRYVEGESLSEVSTSIKEMVAERDIDIDAPSYSQVRNVLQNEVFAGELVLKRTGELVRRKDDLQCVEPETFAKAQEMLTESRSDENDTYGPQDFPEFAYELITRFGQEYAVENIEAIRWCCPECHSIDVNISDTTVEFWNISLPKIYCKECDYSGASIRMKELYEIDTTFPLVCPECQRTDSFHSEEFGLLGQENPLRRYYCEQCGAVMLNTMHPDETERALQESTNGLSLMEEKTGIREASESECPVSEGPNAPDNLASSLAEVPTASIYRALEDYLEEFGPQSVYGRGVLVKSARMLEEDGPLKRSSLTKYLRPGCSQHYSSIESMYEATIRTHYQMIPGFTNPEHGMYDFDPAFLQYLLEWKYSDGI